MLWLEHLWSGSRGRALLHVRKSSADIWSMDGQTMSLTQRIDLSGMHLMEHDQWMEAMQEAQGNAPERAKWTVILDSSWMPMTSMRSCDHPWSAADVNALAQHRWISLYGVASGPWLSQTQYLPGDAQAWIFGLRDDFKKVLLQWVKENQGVIDALQPTLLWALHKTRARTDRSFKKMIHIWCEDDRAVISLQRGKELSLIDSVAALPDSTYSLHELLNSYADLIGIPAVLMGPSPLKWIIDASSGSWVKIGSSKWSWRSPYPHD